MLYEPFDPALETALNHLSAQAWKEAQSVLSERLDHCAWLGRRRLNLFLLAWAAQESGYPDVAEQLRDAAAQSPQELGEPRDLGQEQDPRRVRLAQQWWRFNGWATDGASPRAGETATASELDWATLLDAVLEGQPRILERGWSGLDPAHPQRPLLWNLMALAYLQCGDLRSYDEMREQAVAGSGELPSALENLLAQAGLGAALETLRQGHWLTAEQLSEPAPAPSLSAEAGSGAVDWRDRMEAAFALLAVGRSVEAARAFGPLTRPAQHLAQQTYALNALALALFASGEYAEAEEALAESRSPERLASLSERPEWAADYRLWLTQVGASCLPDVPLCNPFQSPASGASSLASSTEDPAFWEAFEQVVRSLRGPDRSQARRSLRPLLADPASQQPSQGFLVSLLMAGVAILDGDPMDAQESIEEASRFLEQGPLAHDVLERAQACLLDCQARCLGEKMTPSEVRSIDPWHDFTHDFGAERSG